MPRAMADSMAGYRLTLLAAQDIADIPPGKPDQPVRILRVLHDAMEPARHRMEGLA